MIDVSIEQRHAPVHYSCGKHHLQGGATGILWVLSPLADREQRMTLISGGAREGQSLPRRSTYAT